jgi:hypothetical protein
MSKKRKSKHKKKEGRWKVVEQDEVDPMIED